MKKLHILVISCSLIFASQTASSQVQLTDPCGCEAGPLPAVWATVNGTKIMAAEIAPKVEPQVHRLQQQVIEARKEQLDIQIDSRLLRIEAAKLGVTKEQLYKTEVTQKIVAPTDADAHAFYDANRSELNGSFDELKTRIIKKLSDDREVAIAVDLVARLRAKYAVQKLVSEAPVPGTAADRQKALAKIGAEVLRAADIEDGLDPVLVEYQKQAYDLRKGALDMAINDMLLKQEAVKRGLTDQALLASQTTAKVPVITDAQALEFYQQNAARLKADFASLKLQIIQYMQDQEQKKLEDQFVEQLRAPAKIEYFLAPPIGQ
jgi:hypothetical protein